MPSRASRENGDGRRTIRQRIAGGELARVAYLNLNRDPQHSTYVAGDGRSGTTWLADIINFDNSQRYIFEPFHPVLSPIARDFKFFQYLRPDDQDAYFVSRARRVVTGRYRNARVDHLNRRSFASRRLIKDIFSNLLLGWLKPQFPDMPLIMIVRHPCAVAASKMAQQDSFWGVKPTDFLLQPALMADHLDPFRSLIEETTNEFERHILNWCIVHYVPLQQFHAGDIHVVAYEHLCESRHSEIRRIFEFLGRPFYPQTIAASRQPSATITAASAIIRDTGLLDGWQRTIGPSQRRRACDIMATFGLDLYSDGPFPLIDDFNTRLQLKISDV